MGVIMSATPYSFLSTIVHGHVQHIPNTSYREFPYSQLYVSFSHHSSPSSCLYGTACCYRFCQPVVHGCWTQTVRETVCRDLALPCPSRPSTPTSWTQVQAIDVERSDTRSRPGTRQQNAFGMSGRSLSMQREHNGAGSNSQTPALIGVTHAEG